MIRAFKGITPTVAASAYIDATAQIVGDVHIGDESSVWLHAVVRGDVNHIRIGRQTNMQDGSIVHVMHDPSHPTIVGDDITIGHGAIVHGCTIEDVCLIGMGAILLNGSTSGTGRSSPPARCCRRAASFRSARS